jgi:hypothetical protein
MNLSELKASLGVAEIKLFQSTKSSRMVGSVGNKTIITTEEFDASKPVQVYNHPENEDIFILSNTIQRDPDLVL